MSCQACGSGRRDRHPAPHREVDAVRPVADVAERHDAGAADAQHLGQHHGRAVRGLQPLREDDDVERAVLELGRRRRRCRPARPARPRATQAKKPSSDASTPSAEQPRSADQVRRAGRRRRTRGRARASRAAPCSATISRSVRSAGLAARHPVEEGGDRAVVLGHRQQERVVAVRRRDLAERDRHAARRCSTRDDVARVLGGEPPVGVERERRGTASSSPAAARSPPAASPNGSK